MAFARGGRLVLSASTDLPDGQWAALAAPDLVVAELVAEHVTCAPARPGALVVVAELAALDVGHVGQVAQAHDTRRSMPGSRLGAARWWRWSPSGTR